jgi:hypothetical protein
LLFTIVCLRRKIYLWLQHNNNSRLCRWIYIFSSQ